ncbi:MAG: zinc finger domain-containing protein, partial [Acetobacter orientalis]
IEGEEGGILHGAPVVRVAEGEKCVRCWKVLPETGTRAEFPGLCLRCADVVATTCDVSTADALAQGKEGAA